MIFKKIFMLFIILTISYSPGEAFAQSDILDVDIDMNEAKKVAEQYLELMKVKDYDALFNMHYRPDDYDASDEQENKNAHIEILKFYNGEVGDIITYQYKNFKWQKPVMQKHWNPGKNPLTDEPSRITQEPGSLTLIYEVQYRKDTADTTIEILRQDDELKVRRFGLNYPFSFKAMQRMMSIQNKVNALIERKKSE